MYILINQKKTPVAITTSDKVDLGKGILLGKR